MNLIYDQDSTPDSRECVGCSSLVGWVSDTDESGNATGELIGFTEAGFCEDCAMVLERAVIFDVSKLDLFELAQADKDSDRLVLIRAAMTPAFVPVKVEPTT